MTTCSMLEMMKTIKNMHMVGFDQYTHYAIVNVKNNMNSILLWLFHKVSLFSPPSPSQPTYTQNPLLSLFYVWERQWSIHLVAVVLFDHRTKG